MLIWVADHEKTLLRYITVNDFAVMTGCMDFLIENKRQTLKERRLGNLSNRCVHLWGSVGCGGRPLVTVVNPT